MYSHCIRIVVPLSSLVGRDDEDVGYGCCLGISNTACTVLLHTVTCRSVAGYRNVQHYEQTNQRWFYACFACSSPQLYVHCHSMRTHMCCTNICRCVWALAEVWLALLSTLVVWSCHFTWDSLISSLQLFGCKDTWVAGSSEQCYAPHP